ncbi:MAG: hypothetical protein JWR80_3812 [Bradyrhizobium sp.]|nr:hypothetical protein [Bradyrhizobium sp.]
MDWTWYLFSFKGRINRGKLWLALLVIMCWMIFLGLLVVAIGSLFGAAKSFSFGVNDIFLMFDPATYRALSKADLWPLFAKMILTPLFGWVYFATSIKRLHDRDKSGWWMAPFVVGPGLYDQIADRFDLSYAALPLGLAAFIFVLWGFVEMYCLKGSRKTNRFGPNPLAPIDTGPRWEQRSEIEMVPRKAGPPPVWYVKRSA